MKKHIIEKKIEDLRGIKAKKLHNLRIEYAIQALRGCQNFLEVGCGEGFCTRSVAHWSKQLFTKIEGFDLDEGRIALAQSLWRNDGRISYQVSDAEKQFPYQNNQFDAVIMLDILEHVLQPKFLIEESCRVLKNNGLLFLVVPCEGDPGTLHQWLHRRGWTGSKKYGGHVQQFKKSQVIDLLKSQGFSVKWARYSCHPIGQLTDFMGYEIKHLDDKRKKTRLSKIEDLKFFLLKKSIKSFMQKIAYYESKLLAHSSFVSMDLNICCVKKASET